MTPIVIDSAPDVEGWMEIFRAQPGPDYLLCQITRQIEAGENGWKMLPGAPYARVKGRDCALMYRGEVIPGASMMAIVPQFFMDPELYDLVHPPVAPPLPAKKA